ncbi:hypothetical protein BC628DRAFT_924417 [Trametes gibbosa]|uniref:Zinc finger protein 197 n=1 Tax=Trametes gibbosa TaxID=160864 RepID=A0A6B9KK17_9APHY|nr:hypothetical protein BC628DRAFT_924417 [Trametes gibbosa]QHA24570.1 zinc finger protein 197 [Trametes gibbosa]
MPVRRRRAHVDIYIPTPAAMPARCFQCKAPVLGWGSGREHASLTGHTWTPGYYCQSCEATFTSFKLCKAHQKTCTVTVPKPPVAASSTTPAHERKTSISDIVLCSVCGEHFRDAQTLVDHRREHEASTSSIGINSNSKYECSICKLEFTSDLRLAQHAASVNSCETCRMCIPFAMMSLQEHYRSSLAHEVCPWCDQGFASDPELSLHAHKCTARPESQARTLRTKLDSGSESDWHSVDAKAGGASPEPTFPPGKQIQSLSTESERSFAKPCSVTRDAVSVLQSTTSSSVHDTPAPAYEEPLATLNSTRPGIQQLLGKVMSSPRLAQPINYVGPACASPPSLPSASPSPPAIPSPGPATAPHIPPIDLNEGTRRPTLEPKSTIEYDRFTDDADRSSVIAKAALDLLSQRYGMGAAGRVLRAMQELGDMLTDRQSEADLGGELPLRALARDAARAGGTLTPKTVSARSSSPSSAVLRFVASQSADPPTEDVESVHSVKPKPKPAVRSSPVVAAARNPEPGASRARPTKDKRPLRSSAKAQWWNCRSCMTDVCTEPVATVCGHIFCRDCLIRELQDHGTCPVCKKIFLVKLDVAAAPR